MSLLEDTETTQFQDNYCRLCAEIKESLVGILEAEGQKLDIQCKIAKCLNIQVFFFFLLLS